MKKNRIHREIPDYHLERYLLGELPDREMEQIRQETEQNQTLRLRLEALEQSNQELLGQYPPAWMSRQIQPRLAPSRPVRAWKFRPFTRFWPVPVAIAALLIAVLPVLFAPETTRLKGLEPGLALFRQTGEGYQPLEDGSLARQGDRIQIVCQAGGKEYGAILSVDGRGTVTVHLPYAGEQAVQLRQGTPDTLNFSYELDDAPAWERFYLITADIPFKLDGVKKAISRMPEVEKEGKLELPAGLQQHLFTLKKAVNHE